MSYARGRKLCTPDTPVIRKVHFRAGMGPTGAMPTGVSGQFVHRRNGIATRICLALPMQARPTTRRVRLKPKPPTGKPIRPTAVNPPHAPGGGRWKVVGPTVPAPALASAKQAPARACAKRLSAESPPADLRKPLGPSIGVLDHADGAQDRPVRRATTARPLHFLRPGPPSQTGHTT